MNIALSKVPSFLPVPSRRLARLTVRQYHRMIESGALNENDPLELLEGLLVTRMPHTPAHDATIWAIDERLRKVIGDEWIVRVQSAITTKESEPEPDLAVVVPPGNRYTARHPGPQDISLIVEVAYTSLEEDRQLKGRIYSRAHIPVYWIANLEEGHIEVYSEPRSRKNSTYRQRQDFALGAKVPVVIAGQTMAELRVKDLLMMPTETER